MKYTFTLFVALLSIGIQKSAAQNFKTAVDYLEFLNKQSVAVTQDMWGYTSSIARSKGARAVEFRRNEVLKQIQSSVKIVEAKPAFGNQDFIKDAFINYLNLNYNILNEDYAKIVNMEEVAEQSYDQMEAYMLVQDQVNEKMKATSAALSVEVDKYAADNHITLSDEQSKVSQKLERAGKAFDYYEPMYLIFFKSYIQEVNFFAALQTKDFASAEQAKNALKETSDEGLLKVKEISGFDGDGSLKLSAIDILKHYQKEGTTGFAEILDFYTKQDTFEKLDAAMKKKKKSEVTKADTDAYNKAVNEYNAAVKSYNTINTKLNNERGSSLDRWNKTVQDFLMKHAA